MTTQEKNYIIAILKAYQRQIDRSNKDGFYNVTCDDIYKSIDFVVDCISTDKYTKFLNDRS